MACWLVFLMITCHCALSDAAILGPKVKDFAAYVKEGDLNIGYFSKIHYNEGCYGDISIQGAIDGEEVAFALEHINNRSDLLPNITLGMVVLDSCQDALRAVARSVYFLPVNDQDTDENISLTLNMTVSGSAFRKPRHYQVVGTFGLTYSTYSIAVAGLLGAFHIPVISTTATSDELSDKTRFPYFLRMVPPDRFVAEAMVDIASFFNWTYVGLLYSEDPYGENGAKQIERVIKHQHVDLCLAYSHKIITSADKDEYMRLALDMRQHRKARVVFMISQRSQQAGLFRALAKLELSSTFLFLTGDVFAGRGEYGDGSIMIRPMPAQYPGYMDYLKTINPWNNPANPWLPQIWQMSYNCLWNVSMDNNMSCFNFPDMPQRVLKQKGGGYSVRYDSVFVFAYALHNLIKDHCPEQFLSLNKTTLRACTEGPRLIEYLKKVEFDGVGGKIKFDENGDSLGDYNLMMYDGDLSKFTKVGSWSKLTETLNINLSLIKWGALKETEIFPTEYGPVNYIPESVCSKVCPKRSIYIIQNVKCCWTCYSCRENEIIVNSSRSCTRCPEYFWPDDDEATVCVPIPPYYLHPGEPIPIALLTMALFGLVLATFIMVIFLLRRNHKLVRATSRGLMIVILLGTFLACFSVIFFIIKPSKVICLVRLLGFHFAVCLLYSPLMVKSTRIYRIFEAGKRSVRRPRFISSTAQCILTLIMVTLQSLVIILVEWFGPVSVSMHQPVLVEPYVELRCQQSLPGFLTPVAYNLVTILVCATLGYLTRKLPENFNESWHIFISVSTTLFMWLVFLPTYLLAFYAHHQAGLLAFCLLLNAFITIGCLFLTKVYAILFVKEDQMKFSLTMTDTSKVHPSYTIDEASCSRACDETSNA